MTRMSGPTSVFVELGGQRAAVEQVALAVTAAEVDEHGEDLLVLALWPNDDRRKVISSPGNSTVRAAVSVAVAAGNTRAWADADAGAIADLPVGALPEIIRAAVEPCGIRAIQVGAVAQGDDIACFSMWLSPAVMVSERSRERHSAILTQLGAAADADRARADEVAKQAAAESAARAAEAGDRTQMAAGAGAGSASALPDRDHFERTLDAVDCDQAAVLVLGIDSPELIAGVHGADALTTVRDVVTQRLAGMVRKHDVVAYVADDTFAILLVNVDRHAAFDISRRLRVALSEPIAMDGGCEEISISVGLAHEDGLIDTAEMFEAATSAMFDARLEGGARMLIAC